jgi:hypothetical protein
MHMHQCNNTYEGVPKRNKTCLTATECGGVGEGQCQCLFPRPSTVSSETGVFL